MKVKITEEQAKFLQNNILDEDYPSSWDIDKFKSLNSFKAKVEYCTEHLQKLASGSARIAFKIDDQKVLKLAKNKKGIDQNYEEIGRSRDNYFSEVFAEVFDFDQNDLWLEMELAKKVKKSDFKRIYGFSFENMGELLEYTYTQNNPKYGRRRKPNQDEIEILYESDFYRTLEEFMNSYDIPYGDFLKLDSYGIVQRHGGEVIVLVDYGISDKILKTHY